jgi:hypothetical protein
MKIISNSFVYLFTLLLLAVGSRADAERVSVLAVDNATVQPAGARPGDNGKRFFNAEGNGAGAFSSFGVADFILPSHEDSDSEGESIRMLTVTLTQSNAGFTHDGGLHFWLTTDTTTDIQPSDTPAVIFVSQDDPDGLDGQLAPRFSLGSGSFVQVDDGQVDAYSFRLSRQAARYLQQQIRRGGTIRILVSPADSSVAATYAGFSNVDFTGPVLTVSSDD